MNKTRNFSIRTKLIFIYLLIAIPLTVLLGITYYSQYRSSQNAVIANRLDIAKLAASNFSLFIDQIGLTERTIGRTIVDHNLSPRDTSDFLAKLVKNHPASDLSFLDKNGVVLVSSNRQLEGQNLSSRTPIKAVMSGTVTAVGNLQRNADGSPGFIIATGIEKSAGLAGIVSMSINANKLPSVLDITIRTGGVNIVDSSGHLIFQSQRSNIPFNQRDWSNQPFVKTALSGKTFISTGLIFPIDNSLRMGAEIPIPSIKWAAGSFAPVDVALAPIRQNALLSVLFLLLLLAITLLLAYRLGNSFVNALIALKNHMHTALRKGFKEHVNIATGDEIEDLANSFNQMQDEILAAQEKQQALQEELQERNEELSKLYEKQRSVASILQANLLPQIAKSVNRLEIGLDYHSATEAALVGGDFYDFTQIADDKFGILIGDVSGKGIEAAILSATVRNTIKAFAYYETSPARVIEKTNEVAIKETPPSIFVTLFYGVFDATTYNFTYTNAGHWPPVVYDITTGAIQDLAVSGVPIGVFHNAKYADYNIKLKLGNLVVLFTDGVVESKSNEELFGLERLHQSIKNHSSLTPRDIAESIIDDATAFGGGRLYDDAAVMVLRVT